MHVRLAFAAAATMLALVAGCGSDDSSDADRAPLSAERYGQIDRLYQVQLKAAGAKTESDIRAAGDATRRACDRMDESDRLMAALVDGCGHAIEFLAAMSDTDCADSRSCARAFRAASEPIDAVLASTRHTDRAVAGIVDDAGCREALTSPPELYDVYARLKDSLLGIASALESGDQPAGAKALTSLKGAGKDLERIGSARELIDEFRQACGPSA